MFENQASRRKRIRLLQGPHYLSLQTVFSPCDFVEISNSGRENLSGSIYIRYLLHCVSLLSQWPRPIGELAVTCFVPNVQIQDKFVYTSSYSLGNYLQLFQLLHRDVSVQNYCLLSPRSLDFYVFTSYIIICLECLYKYRIGIMEKLKEDIGVNYTLQVYIHMLCKHYVYVYACAYIYIHTQYTHTHIHTKWMPMRNCNLEQQARTCESR